MELGNIVALFHSNASGETKEPGMFEQIRMAGETFGRMSGDIEALSLKMDYVITLLEDVKNERNKGGNTGAGSACGDPGDPSSE